MKPLLACALACPLALGQQTVAPSSDRPGRPQALAGYSVSNSFEAGYRFANVNGNRDLYRASVNYGSGVRLLDARFRIHSLDGKGRWVDRFSLRASGSLGDPYQAHFVQAEKNGWYRYDLRQSTVQYHNRLPLLWRGEHGLATERSLQTHDLTLRPGSRFEILVGYDRNRRTGPGFSSEGIADRYGGFDARNILRYSQNLRQRNDQYRGGFSARFLGLALTATQALDLFAEDTGFADASRLPSAVGNIQPIQDFGRSEPFRGRTPVTTAALRTRENARIGFTARYVYASGSRDSTLLENLAVPNPAGSVATQRETLVATDANREQSSGELTVVFLPTPRWTITNTTAFHNTRIDGQADFLEVGLFRDEFLRFDHLGIRRLSNGSEATFRPAKQVSVLGAYRFSTRRVRTAEALRFPDFEYQSELAATDNAVHAAAGGVRWLPRPGLRASFDFEAGRTDRPLAPTSERRFRNLSARFRWRRDGASLGGFFRNRTNDNPTELLVYSSRTRALGLNASWNAPAARLTVDASYNLLNLNVASGILNLFRLDGDGSERARSDYASRLHNATVGVRAVPHERLTLYAGYSLTQDTVQGRFAGSGAYSTFRLDGANVVARFPLTYQSPQARMAVSLGKNLQWNLGWQFYGYAGRIIDFAGYRAHVGFSSVSVSF